MSCDRHEDCRDRLVDTTLELCTSQGHDATTENQIAAAVDATPADIEHHFVTTAAVIMSVVDDLSATGSLQRLC